MATREFEHLCFEDMEDWEESRRGSRGGAKGAAAPRHMAPSFFCSLLFTLFIVTPTILIYKPGVKIVIITIIKIITFITNTSTHANS